MEDDNHISKVNLGNYYYGYKEVMYSHQRHLDLRDGKTVNQNKYLFGDDSKYY